jgi:hypothetical protein
MYSIPPNYGDKLFVGNLPFNATEAEIWSLFSSFGQVIEVKLLGSNKSRSGQACAFVRFSSHESAISAINHLDARIPFRPDEDPTLLLQVRPARSNNHPSLSNISSKSGSHWTLTGESSPYRSSQDASISSQPTTFEVFQPSLPLGSVRLFVGNIPIDVTATELNFVFREKGIYIHEQETFMMTGSRLSHNSICAFVVAENDDECKKAIDFVNGKVSLRANCLPLKVKIANQMNTTSKGLMNLAKRARSHSDTVITMPRGHSVLQPMNDLGSNVVHQQLLFDHQSDGRFFLHTTPPTQAAPLHGATNTATTEFPDWKEPSVKTYHPYMMLPQSSHYGSISMIPGSEPWRNNGIYSLPPGSYSPYMGH